MSGEIALQPRPPVPGSESPRECHEAPRPSAQVFNLLTSPLKGSMAPSPKATSESGSLRGFEPEGSADVTPPFSESSTSVHSSPAYLRWAENLHNLLADPDGVELYKNYLKMENVGELLDFWFACEGLKRLPADQGEKIYQLIKVINRKFLRSKMVPIQEETRKTIQEKVGEKTEISQAIFDNAQIEVEERMTRTTYQNFLASEMYLNYIQAQQIGPESDFSPKHSDSHSTGSSISGRAGIADDSGHFSGALGEGERSKSGMSTRPPTSLAPGESQTSSGSTSGVSDTSGPPGGAAPAPPAPQHNNSLANNTLNQSRETARDCDPSSEDPDLRPNLTSAASHSALPTLHEDSELECGGGSTTLPSLPSSLLSSLTAQPRITRHHAMAEAKAGQFLTGARVPPHPYHAYNSAYNPVSRQDSELQSVSSHNDTTDDNGSSFTESSSHYSSYRNITNKKYIKRQAKRMQEQSRHNREGGNGGHGSSALPVTTFIPRTARVPTEASNQLPPGEFAAVLSQKLEKLKREQDLNEKLTKKLSEESGSMVSQASSRSLADILREKLIIPDDGDGDQSILDDHVSRVWTDKTPLRSPGDPSGRPRSPGFSRRMAALPHGPGARMAPPQAPHRTLPGRGPSRGPPPPGHLPRGTGPVYHQDLAYYEIEPRGAHPDPRVVDPRGVPHGVIPQGGQTNDRVMEWMLDVERSGGSGSHAERSGRGDERSDQQSHSSRGATKTSPRSKARQHGHRSMSQERGSMSTSWSGHPTPASLHYQAQLDADQKRRLGSSLAMPHGSSLAMPHSHSSSLAMPPPSHSNNSTLRKAAARPAAAAGEVTVAVYTFSHEKGEPMPYRVKIPSSRVTLRHVKDFLPKKGAFRFYFKTEVDGDMCYEEETEDPSLVPLWEGKVLVQCRIIE